MRVRRIAAVQGRSLVAVLTDVDEPGLHLDGQKGEVPELDLVDAADEAREILVGFADLECSGVSEPRFLRKNRERNPRSWIV